MMNRRGFILGSLLGLASSQLQKITISKLIGSTQMVQIALPVANGGTPGTLYYPSLATGQYEPLVGQANQILKIVNGKPCWVDRVEEAASVNKIGSD